MSKAHFLQGLEDAVTKACLSGLPVSGAIIYANSALDAFVAAKDTEIAALNRTISKLTQKLQGEIDEVNGLRAENERLEGQFSNFNSWIHVNHMLPERGEAVLVCTKSKVMTVAYLKTEKKAWQVFGSIGKSIDENDEIHYWRPLPRLP